AFGLFPDSLIKRQRLEAISQSCDKHATFTNNNIAQCDRIANRPTSLAPQSSRHRRLRPVRRKAWHPIAKDQVFDAIACSHRPPDLQLILMSGLVATAHEHVGVVDR